MKWMIASDIHGSAHYCRKLLQRYDEEAADRLLLLGDVLYHGPRNDLPEEYSPKKVCEMLNLRKNEILCVRGNCDAEVDQMVLEFPITAECAFIDMGKNVICAVHGHKIGECPKLKKGDVLLFGHTHVPECTEADGIVRMNPGSVSIPKENSPHSYMTYENGLFLWKNSDGNIYKETRLF